jgi:hypothetical protein
MSQADHFHSTIASEPLLKAASFQSKHGIRRSQVMRRAWQLAALDSATRKDRRREQLGRWMRQAWAEVRRGDTEQWSFLSLEHEARALEHQLTTLQYDDRRTEAHYALMDSLRASIRALRCAAGA